MKNCVEKPESYVRLFDIDLMKNRKLALTVNFLSLIITAIFVVAALPLGVFSHMFDLSDGTGIYFARLAVFIIGSLVYILLHELVHGLFIWIFSKAKPTYGFNGLYAFAGSKAYFNKISYIIIALAPVVLLGAVLAAVFFVVPPAWRWVIYLIQVFNLSAAAGDYFVTVRFALLPKDILINDTGVLMTVYGKEDYIKE